MLRRASLVVGISIAIVSCGSGSSPTSAPTRSEEPVAATTAPTTSATIVAAPITPEPDTTVSAATILASTTTMTEPKQAQTDCRRVTDFGADNQEWLIVNDGVMGGLSNGAVDITDSVMRFTGDVVTQGGGFTSVRLRLDGDELEGSNRVDLRVRADDRTYGLTFEDEARIGPRFVSYQADLILDDVGLDVDGWQVVSLSYDQLRPSVFGQAVDAEPFTPEQAVEVGIIIADGVDGPFALDVDWVDACS